MASPTGTSRGVQQWDALRAFALRFPAAVEDFPWGLSAIKVATGSSWPPVFLWLGARDGEVHEVYVKLNESYDAAVELAGAVPTRMSGVGQFGRLTIALPVAHLDLLFDWVDESYRNVAPKRLITQLDASPPARGHNIRR